MLRQSENSVSTGNKKRRNFLWFLILFIVAAACLLACSAAYAKRTVEDKVEEVVSMVQPIDKEVIETMENENLDEETLLDLKDNWTVALFGIDSREEDNLESANSDVIMHAINILGGINLEVTKSEVRYINSFITETVKSTGIPSVHLEEPGYQHLDGVQAVAYARLRLMDNDFKRTERQRKVLELTLQKARNADFATLNQLIVTILPETASSIDTDDLYILAKNILKLNLKETAGFPFTHYEKTVGGAAYVFPDNLSENVTELHKFLYGTDTYEPSEEVEKISAAIAKKSGR